MRGNVLDESDLIEHNNLRDECDGLEPETIAPHELPARPTAVDNQS